MTRHSGNTPPPTRARPEFQGLTEKEVLELVHDEEEKNSFAVAELTRLVVAYYHLYFDLRQQPGVNVGDAIMAEVEYPIEKVAVLIVQGLLQEDLYKGSLTRH